MCNQMKNGYKYNYFTFSKENMNDANIKVLLGVCYLFLSCYAVAKVFWLVT